MSGFRDIFAAILICLIIGALAVWVFAALSGCSLAPETLSPDIEQRIEAGGDVVQIGDSSLLMVGGGVAIFITLFYPVIWRPIARRVWRKSKERAVIDESVHARLGAIDRWQLEYGKRHDTDIPETS